MLGGVAIAPFLPPGRRKKHQNATANPGVVQGSVTVGHQDVNISGLFVYDVLVLIADSNATAQTKINGAASNAVVGFEPGTHYERKVTGRLGQTYRGHPNGLTVFDGSRAVTGWSGSNPWVASHSITDRGVFIDTTGVRTATGDDVGAQYPEELFYETPGQNTGWTRKIRKGQPGTTTPSAGQWTISYAAGTLRVVEDPTTVNVRISVTDKAIVAPTLAAGGMMVENITFQKYATDTFESAAGVGADHRDWTYRRCAMLDSHGRGLYLGPGDTVTNCKISYNGLDGIGADGEAGGYVAGQTILNTEVSYNKQARYDWGWQGGGSKFDTPTSGTGLVIRNCWWHHNYGIAIWTDLNETETSANTIESNLVEDNEIAGIFMEITAGTSLIRWNTVRRNGSNTVGNNGGPAVTDENASIDISNSRGCTVQQNTVDGGTTGILVRDDDRSPFLDGANITDNSVKAAGGTGNGNVIKFRPGPNPGITTCGADNNRYWTGAPFSYNNVFGMTFAQWQAARTGTGLTGALDPNGTGGLTGTVTDPSTFTPFVASHYGPGG
jgi:parallel beta-helix repeat protein